jgi:hypothetical protein
LTGKRLYCDASLEAEVCASANYVRVKFQFLDQFRWEKPHQTAMAALEGEDAAQETAGVRCVYVCA